MRIKLLAAVAALVMAAPSSAAVQIVENGILTGATGVNVNGTLYDVSFLDGTCPGLFGGRLSRCDQTSTFAFTTETTAIDAATALLEQVFLDSSLGRFDSNPFLTNGCLSAIFCNSYIPYMTADITYQVAQANNSSSSRFDFVSISSQFGIYDSTNSGDVTFARFTLASPVTAAVPEPATWAMMLMGFGGIGFAVRRNRRKTAIAQLV